MHEWTKAEAQIIKAAWATDSGRLALTLIVERLSGLHGASFHTDQLVMARSEGRRSIGIDLMIAINTPLEKLVKEPDEPRSNRTITATERADRAAAGQPAPKLR